MNQRLAIVVVLVGLGIMAGSIWIAVRPKSDNKGGDLPASLPKYGFEVVHRYPHDPQAFTQGLVFEDGYLYEGTGLRGQSTLRRVDLQTGEVLQKIDLEAQYFGEGVAILGDEIVQLTWEEEIGFVYDKKTFKELRQFRYGGQGWGLTHDGQQLIMSDGSSTLRFLDPRTFAVVRRLNVTSADEPVTFLNELEYVEGEIYANIWEKDRIARISPETGKVLGWIDMTGLWDASLQRDEDAVLNGIAYDREKKRLFVTGKLWPWLYEVRIVKKD